ncbi:hypothetical protein PsorP6_012270 [Peronosclerospora sorghi]|uniref:Uncharacterized protein n=1 Tax=Peronosclerospora sorghi TaxID=230839 RepID=A0ACC0WIH0_9STRA|nr:hypothetical protein PsorP6_012270 [Peronosclerospora sorghi]
MFTFCLKPKITTLRSSAKTVTTKFGYTSSNVLATLERKETEVAGAFSLSEAAYQLRNASDYGN